MERNIDEEIFITEVFYERGSRTPRRQYTLLDGLKHAAPNGDPSHIVFDEQGKITEKHWHKFGEWHREDGPAIIVYYSGTDQPMTEVFLVGGVPRAPTEGPYRVRWTECGEVWRQEFAEIDRRIKNYPNRLEL